jgi:iron complex transport system permease protein
MPAASASLRAGYLAHVSRRRLAVAGMLAALLVLGALALSVGAVRVPLGEVVSALLGRAESPRIGLIVLNIRLPRALAAVLAGFGLSAAGVVMQSVLRNPLGSPFTLGISQAAAFGAALAVIVFDAGVMGSRQADAVSIASPALVTAMAFAACLAATGVIIALARVRGATPEVMVLAGVALGSLFTAGTMFLQYFADDVQLAAMVFWSFGDLARADWDDLAVMAGCGLPILAWFASRAYAFNALDAGDETARGLGVRVGRERLLGMVAAALLTAVVVAFLGVIGFVGLICPHAARFIVGDDHRFLYPAAGLLGGCLLLAADVAARIVVSPHVLPVSVLTASLGAPAFILLLLRRRA